MDVEKPPEETADLKLSKTLLTLDERAKDALARNGTGGTMDRGYHAWWPGQRCPCRARFATE